MDCKLSDLNSFFGTRSEAYNFATLVYYLPPLEYKGLTKEFLENLVKASCPYFKIAKAKVHPQHVHYRKHEAGFLLAHLEDYLFAHDENPTGFPPADPPPLQWLYDVILALEPDDPLKLLYGRQENLMEQAIVKIDLK